MLIEDDLNFLREAGCSDSVIKHCIAVAEKALELADGLNISIDRDLVKKGAINHDIGRAKTHELDHFWIGAEMAEKLGFEESVIRIIERHLGAGIKKEEALKLGFPPKDYMPETPEEIIVSYADNLVHDTRPVSFDEALERFRERLGKDHPVIERFIAMHEKVMSWMKESVK